MCLDFISQDSQGLNALDQLSITFALGKKKGVFCDIES